VREKVVRSARQLELEVTVRQLDTPTRTVAEAARALDCDEAEVAKSIVFLCDGEPVVCVASGEHRIDTDKLAEIHDCAEVRQASADEVRAATGFPVGAVPPLGHDLPLIVDETLLRRPRIWAAAGATNTMLCLDPRELVGCVKARVADVAETGAAGQAASTG
jgi:prolyl-tRNA editing enzyme YbaK/EbsC (Cys-tRNA(Pro) deacylase)